MEFLAGFADMDDLVELAIMKRRGIKLINEPALGNHQSALDQLNVVQEPGDSGRIDCLRYASRSVGFDADLFHRAATQKTKRFLREIQYVAINLDAIRMAVRLQPSRLAGHCRGGCHVELDDPARPQGAKRA